MVKKSVVDIDSPLFTLDLEVDQDADCVVFKDDLDNRWIVFGCTKVENPNTHYTVILNEIANAFGFTITDETYVIHKDDTFVPHNIQYNPDALAVLIRESSPFEYAMRIKNGKDKHE